MLLKRYEVSSDWNSHLPLLYLSGEIQVEKYYEFGCGVGSTPALEKMCIEKGIRFVSFETNAQWYKKMKGKNVYFRNNYEDIVLKTQDCVIFVDSAPAETRTRLIETHGNACKLMIVHDTEEGAEYVYGMRDALSKFKYRVDLEGHPYPRTTAVSNQIDVTVWKGLEFGRQKIV